MTTTSQPCSECGESTAPGSGRWVNRVPGLRVDGSEFWYCDECFTQGDTLVCDECGAETHDDESAVFVDYMTGKNDRRVCFDCCPPDQFD